jgi:membrane-associated phospholipid phosphatase
MNTTVVQKAYTISFFLAVLIAICSGWFGYVQVFLALNFNGGKWLDVAFTYITYLGDGWMWAVALLSVLLYNKRYWVLIVITAAISTLIAQSFKLFIFNNQPRPNKVIVDKSSFHVIDGVYLNDVGSFPSGHTTTAFCLYFLACILIPKKWIVPLGFVITVIVAYSRVYQAQHFPIDVAGGIIAAIISVYASLYFTKKILK